MNLGHRDAAAFSGLAVELENLTEWDRHDEMTIFIDHSEESPHRENWRVHVEPMPPLTATVGDLTIEIVRQYRQPRFDVSRDRLDTTATTFSYLRLTSLSAKPMDEWFEIEKAFQDLITLAMDAPCALLSEPLIPSTALLEDETAQARDVIDILGEHILRGERGTEGMKNHDALFTLGSEGGRLCAHRRWVASHPCGFPYNLRHDSWNEVRQRGLSADRIDHGGCRR